MTEIAETMAEVPQEPVTNQEEPETEAVAQSPEKKVLGKHSIVFCKSL